MSSWLPLFAAWTVLLTRGAAALVVDLPILHESERLLAIAKPSGVSHHDDPSAGELGMLSLIREKQGGPNPSFPYPGRLHGVHRLDRVTSGILLLAKDPATAGELAAKFREGEVTKYYAALSGKKPRKKKQGWVRGEMVPGRRGSYKHVNPTGRKGASDAKEERTEGSEREGRKSLGHAATRFFTAGLGNLSLVPTLRANGDEDSDRTLPKTALLFRPHTGKTHQLRVAAKSLGLPILGDARYGGGSLPGVAPADVDAEGGVAPGDRDRTYLHAAALHVRLDDGEVAAIWSPPPFGRLFEGTELSDVYVEMMEKHCDCPPLLEAMRRTKIDV
ncbi:hypothetical protein ACHAWF_014152 [Thalassiosira exigua]